MATKTVKVLKGNVENVLNTKQGAILKQFQLSAMGDSGFTREFQNGILVLDAHLSDVGLRNFIKHEGHYPLVVSEEDMAKLDAYIELEANKIRAAFNNGLLVVGNTQMAGRYYWAMFGASNSRQSTVVFVREDSKEAVSAKKAKLMGLDGSVVIVNGRSLTLNSDVLVGEDGKACLAQLLTRQAARMGSSTPLHEDAVESIRNARVVYAAKYLLTNNTEYRTIDGKLGNSREVESHDGTSLVGLRKGADIAYGKDTISKEDCEYYKTELENNDLNSDKLRGNARWMRIHKCVVAMYQLRTDGSYKGTIMVVDLEKYVRDVAGNPVDIILSPSCRKYEDGPWSAINTIEIMHVSKEEDYKLRPMSAALVLAATHARYDLWKDVLTWTQTKLSDCLSDDVTIASHGVRALLGMFGSSKELDDDDNMDTSDPARLASMVASVAAPLYNDPMVWSTVVDKVQSVVERTTAGGVYVPAAYPFMACDPFYLLKMMVEDGTLQAIRPFNTLGAGEYVYSRKTCRAACGRSPMTNANQFKVVSLRDNMQYADYRGLFIMNCYDCLWLDMSGADFDGDECLLVFEEVRGDYPVQVITEFLDTLEKNDPVVIHTEGKKKDTQIPTDENITEFVVKSLKHGSNVGRLNNLSVQWQELGQHAEKVCDFAEANGCKFIMPMQSKDAEKLMGTAPVMVDPKNPSILLVQSIPGEKVFGSYKIAAVRRVRALAKACQEMMDRLDTLQSIEVDGPKTTVFVEDEEIAQADIKATSYAMLARQFMKNKVMDEDGVWLDVRNPESRKKAIATLTEMVKHPTLTKPVYNGFNSLGFITLNMSAWWESVKVKFANGACKGGHTLLLNALLDEEEHVMIKDCIVALKTAHDDYTRKMREVSMDKTMDEDAKKLVREQIILDTKTAIEAARVSIDASSEEIAVAAYMRCHCTLSKSSAKFAWLCADGLLNVFKRCPVRYTMLRLDGVKRINITKFIGSPVTIENGEAKLNIPVGDTSRVYILAKNMTNAADQTTPIRMSMDGTPYLYVKFDETRTGARDIHEFRVPGVVEGREDLFRAYGLTMRVDEGIMALYTQRNTHWGKAFQGAVAGKRVFKISLDEQYRGVLMSKTNKGTWMKFASFIPDNYNLTLLLNTNIRFIEDTRTEGERKEEGRQCGWSKRGFGHQFEHAEMTIHDETGYVNGLSVEVVAE